MVSVDEMEYLRYEERGNVGIWTITDFAPYFESDELAQGERHYRDVASQDSMDGTIIVIQNAEKLGAEIRNSLDHINEEWSELGDAVGVDRIAYVAGGMMGSAVEANLEVDVETESFDELDDAVEWAQN